MGKIVVFGSIVQDLISYTPRFPRPGESVRGSSFLTGAGGKGANQAVAAARIGGNVQIIGMVGRDIFGDSNLSSLSQSDVDVRNVGRSDKHTATATITVSDQGENSIVVTLGANLDVTEEIAELHKETLEGATIVMAQAEIDPLANRRAFRIAKEAGVTTFFNPAPGDESLDRTILELVDIVCTNENEAEFLTDIVQSGDVEEAKKAAIAMLHLGPHTSIVTLGPNGVVLAQKTEGGEPEVHVIPVPKVQAVDTTGAGDCFCGSLVSFIVNRSDLSMSESVKRAAQIAASSVTRKGTQNSYATKEELEKEDAHLFD